ncbi:hypothetical protein OG897_22080 [Streptomyces sp. NBC_00237]|uniref:hypothetical protein n=1 Tax=Streptomyces sp. NBC_00237 TaxID=2975687 RepID=UPI00225A3D9B|nr:hypothetical protein [Streptomyces sp. NBC_00237]MCX5204127.1 hypothetical protein [Streptomyces sp. NBC_00237]
MMHGTGKQIPSPVRVLLSDQVVQRFTQEIREHPSIEVGGKYVGFIEGVARHKTLDARKAALADITFRVTDYIDAGPNAERSAGFHLGDARHQTQVFRQWEQRYPAIEHIGSWHSHHPNGLARLSEGDVRGYLDTVNHPDHHHDYFFVSLGVDGKGFATAKHYLFIRGSGSFYLIPPEALEVRPYLGPPQEDTPESPGPGQHGPQQKPVVGREDGHGASEPQQAAHPDVHSASAPAHEDISRKRPTVLRIPGWTDTAEGRQALADEQRFIEYPDLHGLRLHSTEGRLLAKGIVYTEAGPVRAKLLYPSQPGGDDGMVELFGVDVPGVEVRIVGVARTGLSGLEPVFTDFAKFVGKVQKSQNPRPGWAARWLGPPKEPQRRQE